MKEKLKLLKLALKEWHQRHSHNLLARIMSLKDKIEVIDLKGETEVLLDGGDRGASWVFERVVLFISY